MSFLASFFNIPEGTGENPVLCPFPHVLPDGTEYYESRPSSHVNTTTHVFNCKVCDRGYNEQQFIRAITGCSEMDSYKIEEVFKNPQDHIEWEVSTELTEDSHAKALSLGISEEVIQELEIRTPTGSTDTLAFPCFAYGKIIDIRRYNPGGTPKIKSMNGATNGCIIPYDIWREEKKERITLICAGEKDMAVARSNGFNAITITGGEKSTPKFLNDFKDRRVVIVYDNDQAGKQGALKVAESIYPYAAEIKVVTGFHEVCCEKGEDITDFFTKYGKTKNDLIKYIKATEPYTPEDTPEIEENYPIVDLYEASQKHVGKIVQSNVQVIAVSETAYQAPTSIIAKKVEKLKEQLIQCLKDKC